MSVTDAVIQTQSPDKILHNALEFIRRDGGLVQALNAVKTMDSDVVAELLDVDHLYKLVGSGEENSEQTIVDLGNSQKVFGSALDAATVNAMVDPMDYTLTSGVKQHILHLEHVVKTKLTEVMKDYVRSRVDLLRNIRAAIQSRNLAMPKTVEGIQRVAASWNTAESEKAVNDLKNIAIAEEAKKKALLSMTESYTRVWG